MALPRKGTRKITVGEHTLRWLARRQGGTFTLIVERYTAPGQKVVATIPEGLFPTQPPIVSPQIVRQCINNALKLGFNPDTPKGQVRMSVAKGDLDFQLVNTEALTRRPVGRPRKRMPGEKRKPVYVSLEKDDRQRMEAAAEKRGLPIGTLAKMWLVERLDEEDEPQSGH